MNIQLRKIGQGRYAVIDGRGVTLGEVYKYEQRFNLRRVYVVRGWRVVGHRDETWRTRTEAVRALLDAFPKTTNHSPA